MTRIGVLCAITVLLAGGEKGARADESSGAADPGQFPSLYPERRFEFEPGMTLLYVDHGEGFPIVFLHGLGADHHQWNDNMPSVQDRFRVIALDFPGHGKSDIVEGYAYGVPKFAAALVGLLDLLGIERAILVGNSMGGHVALYTALHHPRRVERLVLVDAAGAGDLGWLKRELVNVAVRTDIAQLLNPTLARIADGFVVARGQDSAITKELRSKILWACSDNERRGRYFDVLGRSIDSIYENDLSCSLRRIEQKTLVVWGSQDLLVPLSHALRLRYRLPNARLKVFAGVGHVPSVEVPDPFNRTMVRFLRDLEDTPATVRTTGR